MRDGIKFLISFKCSSIFLFQDVVYALAHATGKTGRFTLIERWRNNERLLAPQEHPLKVNFTSFSQYGLVERFSLSLIIII